MKILECLKNNKINKFVVGDEINIDLELNSYTVIDDVRSAGFYAFGESNISKETVVLIINGNYLPNLYTVLTEAWFQKTNLIVIAIYNSIYDIETHYLNRCLVYNTKFFEKDYEKFADDIQKSLSLIGPKLYNIVTENIKKENNYNNIVSKLNEKANKKYDIYLYNSQPLNDNFKNLNIRNIEKKYKYGILSKYMAMVTENENKLLICDSSCIKIDSNIFNNRYINKNFKLIVSNNKLDEINYKKWILANNIRLLENKNLDTDLYEFLNSEGPTVLIVKEEK